jgi:hypothetical protein
MRFEELPFSEVTVRRGLSRHNPDGPNAGDVVTVPVGKRTQQNGLIIFSSCNGVTIQFEDGTRGEFDHSQYKALPPLPHFGTQLRDALEKVLRK